MWHNEGSEEDGDTVELSAGGQALLVQCQPQTADVLQLKFCTKTSREAAKTVPSAARSIPSHCSAVQDTSNAALYCQDTVTVQGLTASCMLTVHPHEVLSNQYTL